MQGSQMPKTAQCRMRGSWKLVRMSQDSEGGGSQEHTEEGQPGFVGGTVGNF